jgi:osmoprotectant transport system ATP-binding protein
MVMNHGKIEQFDTPQNLVKHPQTEYVKQLLDTAQENQKLWEALK